ncbi:MAG: phosphoribosylanthranilate isomerase [Butyrivibrio sp.]|uniref:phosphoribosylanthranilate isomerase n=1 Tax=Butyrivibrio sp. TaxID=28121 RepID=UPI0025BF0B6B|nr:phosphoribosylanthranilate isomerase [Butyrivibrio sp.]MBQ6589300.1 phosphoribosylanthranilate isomerase [Butyrivibrio sp.]
MTKIKMCGLFREEDITYANEVNPDYIGFVFYKKSHRYVGMETASRLRSKLDDGIQTVGVFVDEDISLIKELVDKKIIDIVQLHGHEDEEYIKELRDTLGESYTKIIKAIVVKNESDIQKLMKFDTYKSNGSSNQPVDYYLLDSGMGSGSSFDWNLIKDLQTPIFLAGGLNTVNITEALSLVKPYAVDVSSGIETDKVKDFDKMRLFASLVRNNQ